MRCRRPTDGRPGAPGALWGWRTPAARRAGPGARPGGGRSRGRKRNPTICFVSLVVLRAICHLSVRRQTVDDLSVRRQTDDRCHEPSIIEPSVICPSVRRIEIWRCDKAAHLAETVSTTRDRGRRLVTAVELLLPFRAVGSIQASLHCSRATAAATDHCFPSDFVLNKHECTQLYTIFRQLRPPQQQRCSPCYLFVTSSLMSVPRCFSLQRWRDIWDPRNHQMPA